MEKKIEETRELLNNSSDEFRKEEKSVMIVKRVIEMYKDNKNYWTDLYYSYEPNIDKMAEEIKRML